MGQDTPSNTDLAHKTNDSLKDFLDWLLPKQKWILKKYSTYLLQHRNVIHRATHFLPIISALIVIQVERDLVHAAELNEAHKRLTNAERQIDELRREIKSLKSRK